MYWSQPHRHLFQCSLYCHTFFFQCFIISQLTRVWHIFVIHFTKADSVCITKKTYITLICFVRRSLHVWLYNKLDAADWFTKIQTCLFRPLPQFECYRMNGAIIKGFEEDVGSRTSVFIHTAHSITASLYFFKKHGYTSVPNDEVLKYKWQRCTNGVYYIHMHTNLSYFPILQGIKFVMIPEGLRDFYWLEGLLKGERVRAGQFHNQRWISTYRDDHIYHIKFMACTWICWI